jgi:hypothetical protein
MKTVLCSTIVTFIILLMIFTQMKDESSQQNIELAVNEPQYCSFQKANMYCMMDSLDGPGFVVKTDGDGNIIAKWPAREYYNINN